MSFPVIKLKRGTLTKVLQAPLAYGEPAFASDTKELYISDGYAKHLIGKVDFGLLADRPVEASKGKLYYATDVQDLFVKTDNGWLSIKSQVNDIDKNKIDAAYAHITDTGESHTFIDQDVTKTATPSFAQIKIANDPTLPEHVATKAFVERVVQGLDWQESVISYEVTDPSSLTPSEGDRYLIITGSGDWAGKNNYIAEYKDGAWIFIQPDQGTVVPVETSGEFYLFTGAAWTKFGTPINHNVLSGLQGGNTNERYHLTYSQYIEATQYSSPTTNGLLNKDDFVKIPSQNEKEALAGTVGTPSSSNKYVTEQDPRLTDSRFPLPHASTHQHGGSDEIATTTPAPFAIPKANSNGDLNDWITLTNLNADMLDDYHASLTPSANTIVPLNSSGILDLSTTYIKSNVYTFRRADLTDVTDYYMLQTGEEAIVNFSNTTSVPLHIATQSGTYYECHLVCSNPGGTSGGAGAQIFLNPNNTTYSDYFVYAELFRNLDGTNSNYFTYSAFRCGFAFVSSVFYITNFVQYKNVKGIFDIYGINIDYPTLVTFSTDWRDTTTPWTSLGTIIFPQSTTGYVLVRRLV